MTMARLKAKYEIDLNEGKFHINRPITEDLTFKIKIDDFDVELCLNPEKSMLHGGAVVAGEQYWPTSKIRITVGRDENITPPTPKLVNGHRDFSGLQPYYNERRPVYQNAALEAVNRAILFFKYKLHNPNLSTLSRSDVRNPAWSVEGGEEFSPSLEFDSFLYNHNPGFGIEQLSRQYDSDLTDALQNRIHPELSEELLSDAQSAVFQDNLRRAVLEMAIACETATKQAFFAKTTPAGAAYEYLEEKQKIEASVMDLIHVVAKRAFGRSFKEEQASHYKNIDFLFRCRNKVAHRGELIYRDDSGVHTVDKEMLAVWWESALTLLKWLKANTPT